MLLPFLHICWLYREFENCLRYCMSKSAPPKIPRPERAAAKKWTMSMGPVKVALGVVAVAGAVLVVSGLLKKEEKVDRLVCTPRSGLAHPRPSRVWASLASTTDSDDSLRQHRRRGQLAHRLTTANESTGS